MWYPHQGSSSGGHLTSYTSMANHIILSLIQYLASRCGDLQGKVAQEVADHIHQLFAEFGPPESVLIDNGAVFCSHNVERLLLQWEVAHEQSCVYRPQGNGRCTAL